MVAGVASGLGRSFDVDPVIFRIGFAALVVFGGAGFALYALAWLLLPEEGSQVSIAESLVRSRSDGTWHSERRWIAPALLAVGALDVLSNLGDHNDGPGFGIVLLGVGAYLLWRRTSGASPGGPGGFGRPRPRRRGWASRRSAIAGQWGSGAPWDGGAASGGPSPSGGPAAASGAGPWAAAPGPAGGSPPAGWQGPATGPVPAGWQETGGWRKPGAPGRTNAPWWAGWPGHAGQTGPQQTGPQQTGSQQPAGWYPHPPQREPDQPGRVPADETASAALIAAEPSWTASESIPIGSRSAFAAADELVAPSPWDLDWPLTPSETTPSPTATATVRTGLRKRVRRARSPLAPITVSGILVLAGIAAALDLSNLVDVSVERFLAVALILIGAALLWGGWYGRARSLIAVGVVLTGAAALPSAVDLPLRDGVGDRTWQPRDLAALGDTYRHGMGEATLDLSGLPLTEGTRSVQASLGMGQLTVVVPPDVDVEADASASAGNVLLFGEEADGPDAHIRRVEEAPGAGRLVLDLSVGFGQVEVLRAAA